MAYCKTHLYAQLLDSDLPEDEYLAHDLERYFPAPLSERYATQMRSHRLRREIIATAVANELVDRAGTTFAFRLAEETGARASVLAGAYAVAQAVFNMRSFHEEVERLDNKIEASTQLAMLIEGRQLAERATRWLARANPHALDIALTIGYFAPGAQMLASALPEVLEGADRETFEARTAGLVTGGVPSALAARVAGMASLPSVFDIVEIAIATRREQSAVMAAYFRLGCRLQLDWLRDRIIDLPSANRWQSLARGALRDDLYSLHRVLTQEVLETGGATVDSDVSLEAWLHRNRTATERCLSMFADIKASRISDTTTLAVALREVRNLIRGGAPADGVAGGPVHR
jgi:glutamate dehydrogenase